MHAADIQDRDGGVLLMGTLFGLFPFLLKLYADSGYQGPKFREALWQVCKQINVEIVKRSDVGKFVVLPKRWVVANHWLVEPLPPPCERLGVPERKWSCIPALGRHPTHGQKAL